MDRFKDVVHVWFVALDEVSDDLVAQYATLLGDDERRQATHYANERDRRTYLVKRIAARMVLSQHAPVTAHQWRFHNNLYGKPGVVNNLIEGPLHFNVSQAGNWIALAVSHAGPVGIDIECTLGRTTPVELAVPYFARSEEAALRALPEALRKRRIFELWTLKEAYIKAGGMGLCTPVSRYVFDFLEDGDFAFSLAGDESGHAPECRFWQASIDNGHLVALCAQDLPCTARLRTHRLLRLAIGKPFELAWAQSRVPAPA